LLLPKFGLYDLKMFSPLKDARYASRWRTEEGFHQKKPQARSWQGPVQFLSGIRAMGRLVYSRGECEIGTFGDDQSEELKSLLPSYIQALAELMV
ncbi:Unknown protein, partial [Striga hermonthica]